MTSVVGTRSARCLDRVRQQGKKLGRPKVSPKVENAIRTHLSAGKGILKVAALVGVRERHGAAREEGDGWGVSGGGVAAFPTCSPDARRRCHPPATNVIPSHARPPPKTANGLQRGAIQAREVPVAIRLHARPRIAMRKDHFLTSPSIPDLENHRVTRSAILQMMC